MVKNIEHDGIILAIIISQNYRADGVKFFTPDDFSQQLGYMNHPAGHCIMPHIHNRLTRTVHFTKEVLVIKSGKVRVDFYDDRKNYIKSTLLTGGDVILLAFGGHGFQVIEQTELIEIKQGPYAADLDKIRFDPVSADHVVYE